MKVKVFEGPSEMIEKIVNGWLSASDGPKNVMSITQSQSLRPGSSAITVSLVIFYEPKLQQ